MRDKRFALLLLCCLLAIVVMYIILGVVIIHLLYKLEVAAIAAAWLAFGFAGIWLFFILLMLFIETYNQSNLADGNSRGVYKQRKKLRKLKAKKEEIELKKQAKEEEIELKKKICSIKQEIKKGYVNTCEKCGSKMPPEACFCPQCGQEIGN